MSHDSPPSSNPYAPTSPLGDHANLNQDPAVTISTQFIVLSTIRAVSYSGAVFAFVLVLFAVVFPFIFNATGPPDRSMIYDQEYQFLLPYLVIAPFVGFVIAGFGAAIIAPCLMYLLGRLGPDRQHHWDLRTIRSFGAFTGAICGWGSVIAISGGAFAAFVFGVIPAGFGLILTPLFLRILLRRRGLFADHY